MKQDPLLYPYPFHLAEGLARMGHDVVKTIDEDGFDRGQIIFRDPATGALIGGTDSRTDSQIACY